MSQCVIKLKKGDQEWYLEWSSVTDSPVTYGMSRQQMFDYLKKKSRLFEFEINGMLEQADKTGCSSRRYESVQDFVKVNRAGKKEECLSVDQLIQEYCLNQSHG